MRARGTLLPLPHHPLLRALVLVCATIALIGLVTLGFVVGAIALAVAVVVLGVRRWLARRGAERPDPSIIEGEFTVVTPRPRVDLPRPE